MLQKYYLVFVTSFIQILVTPMWFHQLFSSFKISRYDCSVMVNLKFKALITFLDKWTK